MFVHEEKESPSLYLDSKYFRQFEEALSWRFISELYRRFPKDFKLIEAHPCDGQYDCLILVAKNESNAWQFAIDVNRQGGSVHVHDYKPGMNMEMWPRWINRMLSDDPICFIDEICKGARLKVPKKLPASSTEIITIRFITEFLVHAIGRLEIWSARSGFLDSSGYAGGGMQNEWFVLFPHANERVREHVENDVLGEPAYRFWFLLKDDVPVLCLETTGVVYRRDGKTVDLSGEYKKQHRIWPLIMKAAGDLLP